VNIGEIAKEIGISAPTVRFYESVGLISRPLRVRGWRRYTVDDLERLKMVNSARRAGFSIKDTRVLVTELGKTGDVSKRWQKLADSKLTELDQIIREAKAMKSLIKKGSTCSCKSMKTCIHSRGKAC